MSDTNQNTAAKKCFICMDQGSLSSRAIAVSAEGKIIAQSFQKIQPTLHRENTCEYDGVALLESQMLALEEVMDDIPKDYKITSIGVASQRSTIVIWDKITGLPLCPVVSWLDGRATKEIEANLLSNQQMHEATGLYKTPFYSAPKIRWCLDNYTQAGLALKEGRLVVGPVASYIIWQLTKGKVFACDPTLAQRTMLFNINTKEWDKEILKSFRLSGDILPQIKHSVDDYGNYNGIPITVCVGDQQAAAAGMGVLRRGDVAINYGTGAFLLANAGTKQQSLPGILTSLSWDSQNKKADYILEAPLNVAGSLFTWLNNIGLDFELQDLPDICAVSKNPVWFLPTLGGLGAPYWDFDITPVIVGLTPKTQKDDIITGALRGLAFLIADIVFYIKKSGGIDFNNIRVAGGLSESADLLQFQSDILGVSLQQSREVEMSCLGVAYMCAAAEGITTLRWPVFNAYHSIMPKLRDAARADLYKKWEAFFTWAREQKKFTAR